MIQVNVKTGGLIPSKRLGSIEEYYFSKKINSLNSLNESDYSTLNFGIGNPDLSPANEIIEALKITASSELSHGYQSYNGIPELRDSFSKWYYDKFNVQLNPEDEVLPLLGSKEGILYVSLAYLNFGDKVLIPSLGYPTYESATIIAGGTPLNYSLLPENKWQPDWNQLESLDLTDVKIMWLNYPNMPTGARAMEETFAKAIDFGIRNNILICNDNPYSLILNDDVKSILSFPNAFKIAIELNSLSKSHNMAGWRVGAVFGCPSIIKNILKVKSNNDSGMFLPVQRAAIKALELEDSWHIELNKVYRKRQELMQELFTQLGCSFEKDQLGLFIWAKTPLDNINGEAFSDWLLKEKGIFFTPGKVFGKAGENFIRASLCVNENQILDAINRVKIDK